MKFEHTPGAWIHNGASCVSGENGNCLFTATYNQVTRGAKGEKMDYADARLIAAAPDMLAALVGVYRQQCETCPEKAIGCGKKCASESCDSFPFVKVAIEKATGKSIDDILEGGDV